MFPAFGNFRHLCKLKISHSSSKSASLKLSIAFLNTVCSTGVTARSNSSVKCVQISLKRASLNKGLVNLKRKHSISLYPCTLTFHTSCLPLYLSHVTSKKRYCTSCPSHLVKRLFQHLPNMSLLSQRLRPSKFYY